MTKLKKLVLLLILEIFCFGPAFFQPKVDRGHRNLDEYWSTTDLDSTELESLLSDEICYSDKVSYLACANSINQMAERFGLSLSTTGKLKDIAADDVLIHISEKQALSEWENAWEQQQLMKHPTFFQVWKSLEGKYTNQKNHSAVIASGLNGYLSVAKDPHSYIIPIEYYEDVVAKSDSRQNNLGFVAKRSKDFALVRKIFDGSPAEKAGLKKGDRILKINGVDVSRMLQNQFVDLLKLKDGDRLSVLIERNLSSSKTQKLYFEIIKADYITPSVTSFVLEGSRRAGVLTLHKFAKETCSQAEKQLIGLMEQGVSGVLLDVRDNPGGQVEEAACVLNLFVQKDAKLFETRYMDTLHPVDKYIARKNPVYRGPLAVLINSGSASAAEIVAGALKDLGRATLVGEKTFGKGTFQDGRLWGSHTKVAVFETEGMYYFPSGWTPQLVGIEPDIQVNFTEIAAYREEDLFFNPIIPKDMWNGPQSITWIQLMQCQGSSSLWSDPLDIAGMDPQVLKAQEWLNCRSNNKIGTVVQ